MNKTTTVSQKTMVVFYSLLILIGCWVWNHQFGDWLTPERLSKMNDVPGIWRGFDKAPDFWADSWRWWHGPWIQDGIQAYRPLSSILLWLETAIGRAYGWHWIGWIGLALLAWVTAIGTWLSWIALRHVPSTLFAALLIPTARFWLMGEAPEHWLAWYAVHHDLLMVGFLMSALCFWLLWLQNQRPTHLALTWLCFLAGVLSKEFVYIFPLMALSFLVAGKSSPSNRRVAWIQVSLMILAVPLFYLYRHNVLTHAYNPPPLKKVHFLRRPFLYWFFPFYKYVLTEQFFLPGLSFCLTLFSLSRRFLNRYVRNAFSGLYFPLALGIVFLLYCALFWSVGDGFWYVFEPTIARTRLIDIVSMMALFWFGWLFFKYWKTEPTLAIALTFFLAYIPVWTYLGWHYTIAGWFIRGALLWPLVFKLVYLEMSQRNLLTAISPKTSEQPVATSH